jgi:hypothetical protein
LWRNSRPADPVEVTVRRPGASEPVTLHTFFRSASSDTPPEGSVRAS